MGTSRPRGPGFQFGCGKILLALTERDGVLVLSGIGKVITGGGLAFRVIVAHVIGAGDAESTLAGADGAISGVDAAIEDVDVLDRTRGLWATGMSGRNILSKVIILTPVDLI